MSERLSPSTIGNNLRISSIDILRGLAIVMMGQYHFMRWFMDKSSFPEWLYYLIYIPGKLAAPFFLIISGASAIMFYENYRKKGKSNRNIFVTTLKRGAFLVAITLPLNLAAMIVFDSGDLWEWNIFQLVGVLMLFTVVLGMFKWPSVITGFISVFVFRAFLSKQSIFCTGCFPIIPWANYYFIGYAIGLLILHFKYMPEKNWRYLVITGMTIFSLLMTFFGLNIQQFHHLVGHSQRTQLVPVIIISFLFFGTFSIVEFIRKYSGWVMSSLNKLGYIPLSVYYMHMCYKYLIVVLINIADMNTSKWNACNWLLLNVLFWPPIVVFMNRLWEPKGYKFGVEWFMSKYISPKSIIKREISTSTKL